MTNIHEVFRRKYRPDRINTNCAYVIEFVDGKIAYRHDVCWRGFYSNYTVYTLVDQPVVNMEAQVNSRGNIARVLVDIQPRQTDNVPEYKRALQALISIYEPAFEPGSFEDRWENGLVIPIQNSTLTRDEIGGFLVTMRNLHEQGFYKVMCKALDAGFSPSESAILCQMLYMMDESRMWFTRGYHSMLYPASIKQMPLGAFIHMIVNKNPWFTPEFTNTGVIAGPVNWKFDEPFDDFVEKSGIVGETVEKYLESLAATKTEGYETITYFPADKLFAVLKDLLK